jgi:hypothetical protein
LQQFFQVARPFERSDLTTSAVDAQQWRDSPRPRRNSGGTAARRATPRIPAPNRIIVIFGKNHASGN